MTRKIDELLVELRQQFAPEALESLQSIEALLLQIEKAQSKELLAELKRLLHNFKGSAHAVGFTKAAQISHDIESDCQNCNISAQMNVLLHRIDTLNFAFKKFLTERDHSFLM